MGNSAFRKPLPENFQEVQFLMDLTTIFLLLFLGFNTLSVILFKYANQIIGFEVNVPFIIKWFLNPLVFFSLLFALATRFAFYKLVGDWGISKASLFTGGFAYILILLFGIILFKESMTLKQMIGALLIIIGSVLL